MILDEILAHKRIEVETARARVSLAELTAKAADLPAARDFMAALRTPNGRIGLIAEIKQASPSAGIIATGFDPSRIAQQYEVAGADCLSVLTDHKYFQGSIEDMQSARDSCSLPVLRKDFVVSEYQVHEARAAGADCILLIVAALTPSQVADYQDCARDLGLAVLVETHNADEMRIAVDSGASLIGINSRNLQTFGTDLSILESIAALAPPYAILVAESGIKCRADVDRATAAGAHAILVGETLMRSADIALTVGELAG